MKAGCCEVEHSVSSAEMRADQVLELMDICRGNAQTAVDAKQDQGDQVALLQLGLQHV